MPASKRSASGRTRKASPKKPDGPGEGGPGDEGPSEGPPQLGRNPDADPVKIHREYVQRRLGGGALPTPEAYEDALEEWHKIPGAVRGSAGEVHPERLQREAVRGRADIAAEEEEVAEPPEAYEGPLPATDPGENDPYEDSAR
jgi:hypothetical protein